MPRLTPEDLPELDLVISRDTRDRLIIEVAHCVHCRRIVIAPRGEECTGCGGELHPVSKMIQMGYAVIPESLRETS